MKTGRLIGLLAAVLAAGPRPVAAEAGPATVVIVGDVMLSGDLKGPLARGVDPFAKLRPVLQGADLALGNLEGPLTRRGVRLAGKKYTFRTPPARAATLREAGFAGFTLANNHILDYGPVGLADTIVALEGAGLAHAGAGPNLEAARRPARFTVRGLPIAFLGYNLTFPRSYWANDRRPGTAYGLAERVIADVRAARAAGDQVIVMFHWGVELADAPRDYQREMAASLADAGAALVVGAHPHVAQGVERVGRCATVHSLGDAVFGGNPARSVDSLVVRARIGAQGLERLELLTLDANRIATKSVPAIRTGPDAAPRLARLRSLSHDLGTELATGRTAEGWPCLVLDLTGTVTGLGGPAAPSATASLPAVAAPSATLPALPPAGPSATGAPAPAR